MALDSRRSWRPSKRKPAEAQISLSYSRSAFHIEVPIDIEDVTDRSLYIAVQVEVYYRDFGSDRQRLFSTSCSCQVRDQYPNIAVSRLVLSLADGRWVLNLSGTDLRQRLTEGKDIPSWFTFSEIAQELIRI